MQMTSRPPPRRLQASCHCGNIRVAFDWPGAWPAIPVRACGCGLCTRHGARWTSHPDGAFRLEIGDPALTTCYRFGSKSADFHVCARCGAIPIVTSLIEGRRYAVLNANTFDVERSQFVETATNFEGETLSERLARRQGNWMPEAGQEWPS
jgi:hypothetical protein